MMESIHLSPVLMALCFLISLRMVVLSERRETKGRIDPVLKNVPWKIFFKVFVVWAGILALRELIYYIPFHGVIQTKTTVWWIEKKGSFYLFIFMFIVLMMVLRGTIDRSKLPGKGRNPVNVYGIMKIFHPIAIIILLTYGIEFDIYSPIFYFIAKLLLSLKIVCSGKYLGLFTCFLLAYYITNGYMIFKVTEGMNKKLKKERTYGKAVRVPLLLLITGLFTYLTIPSGPSTWMNELLTRLRDVRIQQQEAFEDLLDAADYMRDRVKKSQALGEIAVVIRQTGDIPRARKILEKAANEILRLQDRTLQFNAFRYLAVILKQSGDNSGAKQMYKKTVEAVQWIKDSDERANALKRVIWEIVLMDDIKWAKDIFLSAVDAAEFVDSDSLKAKLFKKIVRVISESTDKKWADPIYREIALAIAKTGDIHRATSVAENIADIEIEDITLLEIQQRMEKK